MLPHPRALAGYHGTETLPPFQTPAMWLVALTPLTARATQLARMVGAAPRPLPPRSTQPSRGRPVVKLHAKVLQLRGSREAGDLART